MKRLKKRWLLLGTLVGLYGALALSDHGVLYWLNDTTPAHRPGTSDEIHGVIPTFRCHYFTGTGTFSFESSMAFGAETCSPLKRQTSDSWRFARSRFA